MHEGAQKYSSRSLLSKVLVSWCVRARLFAVDRKIRKLNMLNTRRKVALYTEEIHDAMSHVHIKNFGAGDSIVMNTTDRHNDTVDDGIINMETTDGSYYMIITDEETMLKGLIDAELAIV